MARGGVEAVAEQSAAHTPGPWTLHSLGDELVIEARQRPHLMQVASVTGRPGSDEIEANASLIAAAPDLLRELKNCVWLLADLQSKPGLVQEQARVAIAKAEGC